MSLLIVVGMLAAGTAATADRAQAQSKKAPPTKTQSKKTNSGARGQIHVLCGFETATLGQQTLKDARGLEVLLRQSLPASRLARGQIKILMGNQFTKNNVLAFCNSVPSTADDTLFVFLGCHGAMVDGNRHAVQIGKDVMDRNQILNALKRRPHRLVVFLTDACATRMPTTPASSKPRGFNLVESRAPVSHRPYQRTVLESLLMDSRGIVNLNGAAPGQSGFGDATGGFMTQQFIQLAKLPVSKTVDHNGDGKISWQKEFLPELTRRTNGAYQSYRKQRMSLPAFNPKSRREDAVVQKQLYQQPYAFSSLPSRSANPIAFRGAAAWPEATAPQVTTTTVSLIDGD
jgi:hypothetical protein